MHVQEIFKKINWKIAVFALIILVGIYLRTYEFHDFLRFNADQSRDAKVVSEAVAGVRPLPFLGPKAGGTDFRLGPVFYEFQYISAEIFGNQPDKMAYPDLFFSILAIPLLFFCLRKIFTEKLSLSLTALFAVSFFAIKYAHFAWNPNSTPFWTMLFLYALAEILRQKAGKKIFWSIVAGVALGVSVQLHTFLLIALPILLVIIAVYFSLTIKESKFWKNVLITVLFALLLNVPQLLGEFKAGGINTRAFFAAIATKDKQNNQDKNIFQNIAKDAVCFASGNAYILSSLGSADNCELYASKDPKILKGLRALGGIIFSLGGLILAIYYLRKKDESMDKEFFKITLTYLAISFLLFIPLINEISIRYFLVLTFMPFLFLGFWLKWVAEKFQPKPALFISVFVIALLMATNVGTTIKNFKAWSNYTQIAENKNFENTTLKEVEMMADFILQNANGHQEVFLDGNNTYLFKFEKSIEYFTAKAGIKISSEGESQKGSLIFQIVNSEKKEKAISGGNGNKVLVAEKFLGRFTLLKWQRIN